jgi:acyl carrier protein
MEKKLTLAQITERIRSFLLDSYLFGYEKDELCNDSSFLELGILDSTGIMELITFVESEFNITVLDEDILPENIDSINFISSYVYRRLSTVSDVAVGR